jgi:hypothetical protein
MNKFFSDIHRCNIIDLTKIHNRAGNITVFQNGDRQLFDVKRIFYLYDVPGGSDRGGHAHKELHQFIVSASGSFDVLIDDGGNKKIIRLNRPNFGLHVLPGIWSEVVNFSSGAICLVLASLQFDENDYIRDYSEFKKWKDGPSVI